MTAIEHFRSRGVRRPTNLAALAVRFDGKSEFVRLSNISYDGCQLHTSADLRSGEAIRLVLPKHGPALARVRWAAGGRAGAEFL